MSGCDDCKGPGWCERHKVDKPAHWVHLCQTRPDYRAAWEAGRGPGQARTATEMRVTRAKNGLGDSVESMLKTLGITPERYVEVKQMFGLPPTCGCAKRKEWLNKVGRWLNGE